MSFILRDAEYDARCLDCDLARKDIAARSFMLLFDTLLLVGLLTNAGLAHGWASFLSAVLVIAMPAWVMYKSLLTYAPTVSSPNS